MSTKTSLKKIAVIAAMALTLGGFTAISANAVSTASTTSSVATATANIGAATSTVLSVSGGSGDTAELTITPSVLGVAGSWAITVPNKLSTTATNGTSASATVATLTKTTGGGSTGTATLTVTPTAGSAGGTLTVSDGIVNLLVITIGGTTASTNDNPFVVPTVGNTGVTADTPATLDTAAVSISVKKSVASSTDTVTIAATSNTADKTGFGAGNYRYVQVTNSTIKTATGWTLDGSSSVATVAAAPQDGMISGTSVVVNAGTAGQTITVKFWDKSTDAVTGFVTTVLLQTVTITTAAYTGLNPVTSTAFMWATDAVGAYPTGRANAPEPATADDDVLAKSALNGVGGVYSGAGKAVAVIKVSLKDVAGNGLLGTLPAVGASISGPGTLSMGTASNADASTGRLLLLPAAAANVYYVNVFSDGTSGAATISLWVGGAVWKTKTVSFYGAATKLVASQNHKVLKAGTTTGAGCNPTSCAGTSVATSFVVQVLATDANGIAVPGLTYTSVPDAKVVTGSAATSTADADADSLGATWFSVTTAPDAASGVTGTVSYKTTLADTTVLTTSALTFAIGGAPVSVTIAASGSSEVGAKNSLVFTDKDAAGNAPYDLDVPLALTSNVALVVGSASAATNGLPTTIAMIGGTGSVNFFNPFVAGDVTISGKAAGLIPLTVTVSVTNSAVSAAADAAAEATDAANAATDAANAAAEAADAATAAAQDAVDAVAALSVQVTAMISALKKQLIALTNLVIKIQKKVKA
jgi:hypothetical protein